MRKKLMVSRFSFLKNKVKKNELYITQSDKTRKLIGNSRENYKLRMNQNISDDTVITWEEKTTRERRLNGHALQMGRFLIEQAIGRAQRLVAPLQQIHWRPPP